MKMTLTEAYEALIKLSQPKRKKFRQYGIIWHVDERETSGDTCSEVKLDALPAAWKKLIPDCVSDTH
jgi:hypothetical protein